MDRTMNVIESISQAVTGRIFGFFEVDVFMKNMVLFGSICGY